MATRKGRPIADARNILVGSVTPTGTVSPFVGTTAPTGHLSCDGSVVSRTTYSALFAVIGTSHGEGDGSTTFHLPDYRGRFLRGTDESAGRDPDAGSRTAANTGGNSGDAVGAVQDDAIRNITGSWSIRDTTRTFVTVASGVVGIQDSATNSSQPSTTNRSWKAAQFNFNASSQVPTGADNRPVNINVNYIIKV